MDTVSCICFFLPKLTSYFTLCLWGRLQVLFALSNLDPPQTTLPFSEQIYKEIMSFSPIARKDSRRRSGMKLQ